MFCGKCGKKLPDEAKFCTDCGHKLPERKPKEESNIEPVIPVIEQETYESVNTWSEPEVPVEQPIYESENNWHVTEVPVEQTYQSENDWYTPEPASVVKPEKAKKQKPKKKGKAGVVIAIILVLALAAGAAWWFFLGGSEMFGGKKNQIEVSDEVLEEIIALEGLDDFDDPLEITYAKVTETEEYDLFGVDCKDEYITIKAENKYVIMEAGYIVSYSDDDGEWLLENVDRNDEYCEYGHGFISPIENISQETIKELVTEYLQYDEVTYGDISISKHEIYEGSEVELTVTYKDGEQYFTADADGVFMVTPDGWYIYNLNMSEPVEADKPQASEKPESDEPIPIETERNETMPPETEGVETPETEASQGLRYKVNGNGIEITSVGTCTDKNIVIPAEIDGKPVTCIGEFAFHNCEFIETVTMPDTVTQIHQSAFYECVNLKTVAFSSNLETIAAHAFYKCTRLTNVKLPDTVWSIGESAFAQCDSITTLVMPKSLTSIQKNAFFVCDSLTTVELNSGLMTIGESAFSNCSKLAEINIPDTVETIGNEAFCQCDSIKQITIPNSVNSLGRRVFASCDNLATIYCDFQSKPGGWEFGWLAYVAPEVIWQGDYNIIDSGECGDNLTWTLDTSYTLTISGTGEMWNWGGYDEYPEWIFGYHDSIKRVIIEEGVTSIGVCAFQMGNIGQYPNIIYISIPNTVTKIHDSAFTDCLGIESIVIPASVVEMGVNMFTMCDSLTDIYCEATSKPAGWSIEWNLNCNATVHWGYGATTPETEAPQTTPPETEPPQTTLPETEAPVVSEPKASLRVPVGYEVAVFTHDSATDKTIIIAKNTSDKMYYILDTNGNLLIDKGYDSYSNIGAPYFGLKSKIYKYNFSKNTMEDVVREVYERLVTKTSSEVYYNKEMDLLVTVNEDWDEEWDKYTILDSRYNSQYYEMQISLLDSYPKVGTYETRQALINNGNPYDMIGHTPVVVKRCSFSASRMRLVDNFEVQMIIDNFSTTNKYGVLGTNIPFDYDELYAYAPEWSPLWYVANVGSDWGVIDNSNKQIIKFKYGDIMVFANFEDGGFKLYAAVSKMVNGKKAWGVVDEDGNTIVPFEYEQIVPINFTTELKQFGFLGVAPELYNNENLEFYVKKNGNWSAISAK